MEEKIFRGFMYLHPSYSANFRTGGSFDGDVHIFKSPLTSEANAISFAIGMVQIKNFVTLSQPGCLCHERVNNDLAAGCAWMHFHILNVDKSPKYLSPLDILTCHCNDQ